METYAFLKEILVRDIFLKDLIIILVAVKVMGILARKLRLPPLFGKLLVGIILGPSLLGILHPGLTIKKLAETGVILLMFLAGLETDLEHFKKSFLASILAALGGVILPLVGGLILALKAGFTLHTSLFIGVVLVATSVSITVETLREIGRLNSPEGYTILGAAVIDDILGLIALSIVLNIIQENGQLIGLGILGLKIIFFFIFILVVGFYFLRKILNLVPRDLVLALVIAFLFALIAEYLGLAAIIGAYLAGIVLSQTKYGHRQLFEKIEILGHSFFFPIFFVSIGISADISSITQGVLIFTIIGTILAIITKIIGAGTGAMLAGFNFESSMGIGMGMVSRGEVALIVANMGLGSGIISIELYTSLIIITLITTLITPILIQKTFL